jgi:hypothetical protein
MVSNTTISTYIDSKIEEEAIAVLAEIALTPSDAFRLLMTRAESGRVKSFGNLQEFMDNLHADNFDFIKFGFDNVLF